MHVRAACENLGRDFAGALLRPHGWVLRHLLRQGDAQDVLDAARRAGREWKRFESSHEGTARDEPYPHGPHSARRAGARSILAGL
ncbi:MAG: hypothetical protein ACE5IJ_03300 [Thermoplasmata archaeon]